MDISGIAELEEDAVFVDKILQWDLDPTIGSHDDFTALKNYVFGEDAIVVDTWDEQSPSQAFDRLSLTGSRKKTR